MTTQGIGILVTYGKYLVEFYFSLGVLWLRADRRRVLVPRPRACSG